MVKKETHSRGAEFLLDRRHGIEGKTKTGDSGIDGPSDLIQGFKNVHGIAFLDQEIGDGQIGDSRPNKGDLGFSDSRHAIRTGITGQIFFNAGNVHAGSANSPNATPAALAVEIA